MNERKRETLTVTITTRGKAKRLLWDRNALFTVIYFKLRNYTSSR